MDRFYKMRTLTKCTEEIMIKLDTKYPTMDRRAKCVAITQCISDILITTLHIPLVDSEYGRELLRDLRALEVELNLDDRALLMVLGQELSLMLKAIPEPPVQEKTIDN